MVFRLIASILLVSIALMGANHVTFREVPASESGITWSHEYFQGAIDKLLEFIRRG